MAGTIDPSAYRDAVVVLATAGVIVPFAKRFRVNSVVAFMACGALLGPYGLGGLAAKIPFLGAITVSNAEALAGPAGSASPSCSSSSGSSSPMSA